MVSISYEIKFKEITMKIKIDKCYFQIGEPSSANLITSLKKLSLAGYAIAVDFRINELLLNLLSNEGIIIEYSESHYKNRIIKGAFETINEAVLHIIQDTRKSKRVRVTKETSVTVEIFLDKPGLAEIKTGLGFFDHILEQISRHGNLGLRVNVAGDLHIDEHHTIEDTGIALGEAICEALGNKIGIQRYGFCLPMDDAAAEVFLDLGGRAFLNFKVKFNREKVGEMPTELVEEFFRGLSAGMKANIYIKAKGKNDHHKIESIFKAFAKALNEACKLDERAAGILPSTKGIL